MNESHGLKLAFWRETLIHAAIYREWVENLGARQALGRIAHLLCELATRLELVGLVDGGSFHLPLTQHNIADACGLSVVHVNRTLQELRRHGLPSYLFDGPNGEIASARGMRDEAGKAESLCISASPVLAARNEPRHEGFAAK